MKLTGSSLLIGLFAVSGWIAYAVQVARTPSAYAAQAPRASGAGNGGIVESSRNRVTLGQDTSKKFPPLFPRSGATKVFENDKVVIWDDYTNSTEPYMHIHVRDTISILVQDGPIRSIDENGKETVSAGNSVVPSFLVYTRAPRGPHSEAAVDPSRPRRIFRIELKGTEPWNCKDYSTDPACVNK